MGILVITWNFPPRLGGMENLIAGLCHNLKKTHPLFVITSSTSTTASQESWIFRAKWRGLVPFLVYALCKGSLLLWREPEIKLALGGSALVTPLIVFLASIFRKKAVVHVHGSDLVYRNVFYQVFFVRWLRSCDQIVANSRYTAGLAEGKGVKKNRISVIPPAVDVEVVVPRDGREIKKRMGLEGRKVLLYVGRLARRKGVKEFVEKSLPKIISEVPEVCFVVVGENPTESLIHHGDMMGDLQAFVREVGLQNHVRLLGWLSDEDLAKIYQACDLVVLPVLPLRDDVEGFGIVLLEAAAAGKPCVATRVGGIPDALEDGKSGILLDPGNYKLMSQTIVRLLGDDRSRIDLGEYARKRVREEFAWDQIVMKYEEMFGSTMKKTLV